MRYYNIVLSEPKSGLVYQYGQNSPSQSSIPSSPAGGFVLKSGGSTFTSYAVPQQGGSGYTIAGALNVEFDFPVVSFDSPQGQGIIRVWGVGLQMIGQAADLNGANITLSAGMQKGLPLANPKQAGIILQGTVYQAFGNWEGVNQTLDLIVQSADLAPPNGIAVDWAAGTTLSSALSTILSQAFPKYKQDIKISSSLQPPGGGTQCGWYRSLYQFAGYLLGITAKAGKAIYGDTYSGVMITIVGSTIRVFDNVVPQTLVQIDFNDMIGQPTWIRPGSVSFKTVLRSDISVGTQIKFPQGIIAPFALTSTAAAAPNVPARSKSVFQGTFIVNEVHHFANFRQPDGNSWNTTFTASPVPPIHVPTLLTGSAAL